MNMANKTPPWSVRGREVPGRFRLLVLRLPALSGQAGLPPEGADPDGQELARDFRAGGGLDPG